MADAPEGLSVQAQLDQARYINERRAAQLGKSGMTLDVMDVMYARINSVLQALSTTQRRKADLAFETAVSVLLDNLDEVRRRGEEAMAEQSIPDVRRTGR